MINFKIYLFQALQWHHKYIAMVSQTYHNPQPVLFLADMCLTFCEYCLSLSAVGDPVSCPVGHYSLVNAITCHNSAFVNEPQWSTTVHLICHDLTSMLLFNYTMKTWRESISSHGKVCPYSTQGINNPVLQMTASLEFSLWLFHNKVDWDKTAEVLSA